MRKQRDSITVAFHEAEYTHVFSELARHDQNLFKVLPTVSLIMTGVFAIGYSGKADEALIVIPFLALAATALIWLTLHERTTKPSLEDRV